MPGVAAAQLSNDSQAPALTAGVRETFDPGPFNPLDLVTEEAGSLFQPGNTIAGY